MLGDFDRLSIRSFELFGLLLCLFWLLVALPRPRLQEPLKTLSCSFVPQDDLDFCSSNARDREKRERRRSDIGARRAEHGGSRGGEGRGVRHAARSGGARGSDDARFAGERGAASARGEEGCVVASRRRDNERRGHRGKEERGRSLSHWRGDRTAPTRKGERGRSRSKQAPRKNPAPRTRNGARRRGARRVGASRRRGAGGRGRRGQQRRGRSSLSGVRGCGSACLAE